MDCHALVLKHTKNIMHIKTHILFFAKIKIKFYSFINFFRIFLTCAYFLFPNEIQIKLSEFCLRVEKHFHDYHVRAECKEQKVFRLCKKNLRNQYKILK